MQQRNKAHVDFGLSIEKAPQDRVVSSPVCHLISPYKVSVVESITEHVIKSTPCGPYHVQVPIDAFDAKWLKNFQTEQILAPEQKSSVVESIDPSSRQLSYTLSPIQPYLTEKSITSRLKATNGISQKIIQVSFKPKPKPKLSILKKKKKAPVSLNCRIFKT